MVRHYVLIPQDGQRIIRKFLKNDPVRNLFSYIKNRTDLVGSSKFDLSYMRDSLLSKLDSTLTEANLLNGAIMIEMESDDS